MSRFNPRYVYDGNRVSSICGLREEDLLAILDLCVENSTEAKKNKKDRYDALQSFNDDKLETVEHIRKTYTKSRNGTVKFDTVRAHNDPLSMHRIDTVFTSASLQWSRTYDNDSYILVYLSNLRDGRSMVPGDPANLGIGIDTIRVFLTMKFLQAQRAEYYRTDGNPTWRKMKECYSMLHFSKSERQARMEPLRVKKQIDRYSQKTRAWL